MSKTRSNPVFGSRGIIVELVWNVIVEFEHVSVLRGLYGGFVPYIIEPIPI